MTDRTINPAAGGQSATKAWRVAVLAALFAFVVYLVTLAPGITWHNDAADGGDLITATVTGGVPHPSGYPTYLLLGEVVRQLPLGTFAYRFNLMSALAAAGAVGMTAVAAHVVLAKSRSFHGERSAPAHSGARLTAAGVVAVTFALSSILWSQAVVAEVYALNAFLVALVLCLWLLARATDRAGLWLAAAAAFGLGLGNHLSLAALAPAGLVLFLAARRSRGSPALAAGILLASLAGLAVYIVLPLRAAGNAPVNWGGADTWEGLVWLVTGRAYAPLVGALPVMYLPQRILAAAALLVRQAGWWGVPVAFLGLRALWRTDRPVAIATLTSGLLIVVYALAYNTADSYVYLIPATMMVALWSARGLADLLALIVEHVQARSRQRVTTTLVHCGAVLLIAVPLAANWAQVDASHDRAAEQFGRQSLLAVDRDAVIVADSGTDTFPLWYYRYAEGLRPDVAIINGHLLAFRWYHASLRRWHGDIDLPPDGTNPHTAVAAIISDELPRRPVYVTTRTWKLPDDLRLVPAGDLLRVEAR